jgi:hypothetical protein
MSLSRGKVLLSSTCALNFGEKCRVHATDIVKSFMEIMNLCGRRHCADEQVDSDSMVTVIASVHSSMLSDSPWIVLKIGKNDTFSRLRQVRRQVFRVSRPCRRRAGPAPHCRKLGITGMLLEPRPTRRRMG